MSAEKWDILSADGRPTGRTVLRGQNLLKAGEYHLVVHIWIVSPSGEYLIQRRSDHKKLMPGEWAATGGAAMAGEGSFAAAQRELHEELGIRSNRESLKKLLRIRRKNSLLDVWLIRQDVPIHALKLQKSEVAEAKWITKDRLFSMIATGEFHHYGQDYFDSVFSKIEEYRGAVL